MWTDVVSPVAFAPPPAVSFRAAAGKGVARRLPLEKVLLPNAYGSSTFSANVALVSISLDKLEEAPSSRVAAELAIRLSFLRVEAERENIPFSESSRDALWSFIREFQPSARPRVYLNDNGNLRAMWKNASDEQIGLEFLGGGAIQFVIFKRRLGFTQVTRIAGVESEDRIFGHIRASNAQGLLFA
jgi:hypothetical protein